MTAKTKEEFAELTFSFQEGSSRQRDTMAALLADAFETIAPGVEKFRLLVAAMGPDNVGYVEITSLLKSIDINLTPKVMNIIQAATAPEQVQEQEVPDEAETSEEPVTS